MNILKWFWININFREWTFEGRKLVNPFVILFRIMLWPIIMLTTIILCGLLILSGNRYNAEQVYENSWPF